MRARRLLRWVLGLGGLSALLFLLLAAWGLRTGSGRDFLLARATALLPPGATLQWSALDGTLAGPLEIRGIDYRGDGVRVRIARARIDHGLWPLLSRRLQMHALELDQVQIDLARDDQPFRLPRWPEVLPTLELPLTLAADRLVVRGLVVRRAGLPLLAVSRADGGLELGPGFATLRAITVASDRGTLRAAGHYRPGRRFDTALAASLQLPPVEADATPARLRLAVRGNLDDALLTLDGQAPGPLRLRLRLREGGGAAPRWRLEADSTRLRVAELGFPIDDQDYGFALKATGLGGGARIDGRITRGLRTVTVLPSQVRVEDGMLRLAPLSLGLAEGPLQLRGTVALKGEPHFDLRLRSAGLRLQGAGAAAPEVLVAGQLQLRGPWRDYRLEGSAQLVRAGQQAQVNLAGRGNSEHLSLQTLRVRAPTGTLEGAGELRWAPDWQAAAEARLAGFDPGYFLPDYPGVLNGRVSAQASHGTGGWQGQAMLENLSGQLRRRPMQGRAAVRFANGSGEGDLDLRLGASRIEASGRFGPTVDLQARFSPLELSDLLATGRGRVQGRVAMRGPRAAPGYQADLRGQGLSWQGWSADSLLAVGALPASGRPGELRVSAQGVHGAGQSVDQATLVVSGSLADFRAAASLRSALGSVDLQASAAGQGRRWAGRLATLQVQLARAGPWSLQGPAAFRLHDGSFALGQACLRAAGSTAGLCARADGRQVWVSGARVPWALAQPWLAVGDLALEPFGTFDLDGRFARAANWSGRLRLTSAAGGLRIDPTLPREVFSYSRLDVQADLLPSQEVLARLQSGLGGGGSLSGSARLRLAAGAPLQGALQLDVRDLTWLELLSTDLAGPRGRLTGTLTLGGTLAAPLLSGDARLAGFAAELPVLGVELRDGQFALRGEPGGQARITGQLRSGKGRLLVDGRLDLADPAAPVRLTLGGEDVTVANTPDLQATMSPDLSMDYADGLLTVRGAVRVPSARLDLERLDRGVAVSPDVVVLDPRGAVGRTALRVDTDVELQLGERVALHGFGLDGKLAGGLRVVDRPGRPPLATGTLSAAGSYSAYGRELTIERGRLAYVNASIDNPQLDILAEREIEAEGVTVGVRVRGNARAPETTVTSTPSMSTAEALSWLVLGRPLGTASGAESQRISASALALSAGSNLLAQRIGARLGLDSAGITESRALGGSTLQVGKQVSPRLFVSYGLSLIGTGQVVTLKYLLKRGLNVSLESGDVETAASLNWRREK